MSGFWRNWVVFTLATVPATGLGAASAQSMPACYAQVKTPSEGGGVALTGEVAGRSATPGDVSVWVLTHRKGLKDWWPQNGGPVQGGSGDWSAKVTYGTSQEAGQPFEVVAVPVDTRTNEGLVGWTVRASTYHEFGGIPLPLPAPGCRYNVVEVRRVQ